MKQSIFAIEEATFGCAPRLNSGGQVKEKNSGSVKYYSPERLAYFRNDLKSQIPDSVNEVKTEFDAYASDMWALGLSLF